MGGKPLFTPEQIEFLAKKAEGITFRQLADLFYQRFGIVRTSRQLCDICRHRKITNKRNVKFMPGHKRSGPGRPFPKGYRPPNWLPVGSERIKQGRVDIKIAEPDKWRAKARVLWERRNGPLPKGHTVIFADGDNRNFALDNLVKVSCWELLYLRTHRLLSNDAELTKVAVTVAKLSAKACERQKKSTKTSCSLE